MDNQMRESCIMSGIYLMKQLDKGQIVKHKKQYKPVPVKELVKPKKCIHAYTLEMKWN
jgi:hypothetical protein